MALSFTALTPQQWGGDKWKDQLDGLSYGWRMVGETYKNNATWDQDPVYIWTSSLNVAYEDALTTAHYVLPLQTARQVATNLQPLTDQLDPYIAGLQGMAGANAQTAWQTAKGKVAEILALAPADPTNVTDEFESRVSAALKAMQGVSKVWNVVEAGKVAGLISGTVGDSSQNDIWFLMSGNETVAISLTNATYTYLDFFTVSPHALIEDRRYIGVRLLGWIARERHPATLEVEPHTEQSRSFYLRLGAEPIPKVPAETNPVTGLPVMSTHVIFKGFDTLLQRYATEIAQVHPQA